MPDFDPTARDFPPPSVPVRPDWLARTREQAEEPDLSIIDAHHHIWNRPHEVYMADDLLADLTAGHNVIATVYAQCRSHYRQDGPEHLRPVGETDFVRRLAEALPADAPQVGRGIVAHAALMRGAAVAEVLDAHVEAAPDRMRGIRDMTTHDARLTASFGAIPAGRLLDPTWREGFAQLAPRGLSYDCYAFHTQLAEVADLARAFPDTAIILNHIGGPLGAGPYARMRDEVFTGWSAAMRTLAQCPNVSVKVGGFGMHNYGHAFDQADAAPDSATIAAAIGPYVALCVEAFGADRCMFESNFPVDKGMVGYVSLWNAFKQVSRECSAAERADLFAGCANRVYRLNLDHEIARGAKA